MSNSVDIMKKIENCNSYRTVLSLALNNKRVSETACTKSEFCAKY